VKNLKGKNVGLRKARAIKCLRPLCSMCGFLADGAGGSGIALWRELLRI